VLGAAHPDLDETDEDGRVSARRAAPGVSLASPLAKLTAHSR
jgi:glucokinase